MMIIYLYQSRIHKGENDMDQEKILLSLGITIDKQSIYFNLKRIINQVYKLLPMREQGRDWKKPLQTLIEQLSGMKRLIIGQDDLFFLILCKMEGLFSLTKVQDMELYRRTIFACLGLLNSLNNNVCIK